MDSNAGFLAVLHEVAAHLEGGALLDVLEDLGIAGFEADDQQPAAGIGHGLQSFVIAMNASRAGPLETNRLEISYRAQVRGPCEC